MKLSKQLISFLLVIVMVIGLLPYSAFANTNLTNTTDPGNNGETGYEDQGTGGSGTATWSIPGRDYWGVRFSLYFSEDKTGKGNFEPVGKTIDTCMTSFGYTPNRASMWNVFDRMNGKMNEFGFNVVDYSSMCLTRSSSPALQKFPNLMQDGLSSKVLNKYFMGIEELPSDLTTIETKDMDFTNTDAIVDLIIKDTTGIEVNFKDGIYKTKDETRYGIFKLYYEPIFYFKVNSTTYAMTLRDAIAFYNCKPNLTSEQGYDFVVFYFRFLKYLANAAYLVQDEVSIGMNGNPSGTLMDSSDSSSDVKSSMKKGGLMYDSMGVGVVTGGIYGPPGPEIYKTYVFIDSVDADGNITYKKADPTIQEPAEFIIDDAGNLTQTPNFNLIEGTESGLAVLNDIFSVPMDLNISENTEWVNTDLITNVGTEVRPMVTDIPGYNFSLVTGSDLFIQSVVESSGGFYANGPQASRAVEETANDIILQESVAGSSSLASAELSVNSFVSHLPVRSIYFPYGVYIYVHTEITSSIFYENFEDIKLGMYDSASKNNIIKSEINENHTSILDNKSIPANNLVLRYIVVPKPGQFNVIERRNRDTGEILGYIYAGRQNLEISEDNTVTIQKPVVENLELLGDPEIVEWVTNSEYPVKDISGGTLPDMSSNGLTGTTESPIPNYPIEPLTHNLYVKWVIYEGNTPPPSETETYNVPEWRLSKYWGAYGDVPTIATTMSLPVSYGCCWETLSPSGPWNYTTRNPNGLLTVPGHIPTNLKLYSWIHSETVHSGSKPSVTIYSPSAIVPISSTIIGIKSTDTSNLTAANWLNKESLTGLLDYDIQNNSKGNPFNQSEYKKNTLLSLLTYNLDTYTNQYTVPRPSTRGHRHRTATKIISPSGAGYTPGLIDITITFDRYLQQNTDNKKLTISPEIKVDNGLTTLKYQLKDTINVYPEVGMLFANDQDAESIKWVVGDQARKINPVVWQTLEHKVYVVPTSSGTSVATDSRAITKAQSIGEGGKQVIHKGAGVNTTFQLFRDEDKDTKSILTVKTFALDFASSSSKNASTLLNGVDVKSAWGNSAYNSQEQHNKLIAELKKTGKADATEKLLVDINFGGNAEYTGATKSQKTANYKVKTYGGKEVTTFEHQLIVRGGSLIAVGYNDRSNPSGALKWYTPTQLKTVDEPLYNAIIEMNLYNESGDRSKTVFSTFEHLTGDTLTESKYASDLESARNQRNSLLGARSITTPDASKVVMNKGWYSEDTTVLVIKEYVTNFEVPSISFGDKLSMTVGSLTTPIDKGQFYSQMGKGYTYLEYDLKFDSVYAGLEGSSAKFEFTSLPSDAYGFGQQKTDYLVPNVSITDTTRLY